MIYHSSIHIHALFLKNLIFEFYIFLAFINQTEISIKLKYFFKVKSTNQKLLSVCLKIYNLRICELSEFSLRALI